MQKVLNFESMSSRERKSYLSMDLIERMIRVEQRVAASFHKYLPYEETEYYKSLSEHEKQMFEKYLSFKRKKKLVVLSLLIAPSLFLVGAGLTGGVIFENSSLVMSTWAIVALVVILIGLLMVFFFYAIQKRRNHRLHRHAKVIEHVYLRRHLGR